MTMVRMIDKKYTIDGMILCFFFMSLQCPAGVDKKHVPAMLKICPIEQRMAQATTSKSLKMKTKETINDRTIPMIEQASQPIILVLYDRSPHKVFSLPKENILFSSFSLFPSSNAFPIQLSIPILKQQNHKVHKNRQIKHASIFNNLFVAPSKRVYNIICQNFKMEIESNIAQFIKVDEDGYICITGQSYQQQFKPNKHLKGSTILAQIINTLGERSAISQKLKQTITTSTKFYGSEHRIYLRVEGSKALGFIKVGEKKLFYHDHIGAIKELFPTAVLDFYVHQSCQRNGFGKEIFQKFLKTQNKVAEKVAYDRPSQKLISFLKKHYGLSSFIPQNNNYVIFDKYFWNTGKANIEATKKTLVESNSVKTNGTGYKHKGSAIKQNQKKTFQLVESLKGVKDQSRSSFGCPWATQQKVQFKTSSNCYGNYYHHK